MKKIEAGNKTIRFTNRQQHHVGRLGWGWSAPISSNTYARNQED